MTVERNPWVTVITGYHSGSYAPMNEGIPVAVLRKGEDIFDVLCNIVYSEGVRNLTRPLTERGNLTCFCWRVDYNHEGKSILFMITDPLSRCYIFFHTCIEPASVWGTKSGAALSEGGACIMEDKEGLWMVTEEACPRLHSKPHDDE